MISSKRYVEEDSRVALRVGPLGVSLDSVAIAFQQGHSAETIQQLYPALSLEEVYEAIAYYLANRDEVHQYLDRQEQLWDRVRQRAQNPSPVVQRLRALNKVPRLGRTMSRGSTLGGSRSPRPRRPAPAGLSRPSSGWPRASPDTGSTRTARRSSFACLTRKPGNATLNLGWRNFEPLRLRSHQGHST